MAPGFLVVTSEPGKDVSLEEFQDWYNNEHVPIRLNYLQSFLTGARFSANDGQRPSWLAMYDVDDTSTFSDTSYTRLRETRSQREANLIQRLELLDRRTTVLLSDTGKSDLTSSLEARDPTKFLITLGVQASSDGLLEEWFDSTVSSLKGEKGWVRSRSFKCIDSLRTGSAVIPGPEGQKIPSYLVVIEMLDSSLTETQAFKDVVQSRNAGLQIDEIRKWDLYRAYPSIAQGNVSKT